MIIRKQTAVPVLAVLFFLLAFAGIWLAVVQPVPFRSSRDRLWNRNSNGIWLQHGWLGADDWFDRNDRDELREKLRTDAAVAELADRLLEGGVSWLFPHLAPTTNAGLLPAVDVQQTHRFFRETRGMNVLPWVGGVVGKQVFPDDPLWQANFIRSVADLLNTWPEFAGIHLNIEPWPSGDPVLLDLLRQLKQALPAGKILSLAAYPPPSLWQPSMDVHWDREYYQKIGATADQLVVMMYDTSIPFAPIYRWQVANWTEKVLSWTDNSSILLGLPAYDDAGTGYHRPAVENLANGLAGVSAGLAGFSEIPAAYLGVAVYSDWEMDAEEWLLLSSSSPL